VSCVSTVREQKRIIDNEIQELRTKINNHLDSLQENLMTELDEAEIQVTDETRELNHFCNQMIGLIEHS
jgi:uncharacterized coiled-coil DUF342 family protein